LLHLFGYKLPLDELKNFRQWGSKTPGHPEWGETPGVETTTGPLGQGFANGVGIALSGKLLAERYNQELFGYRVYGVVSDGDLMEGISSEAASLAGHLKLGNIVYVYDDNRISIGGSTDICFTESVPERFKAYGWSVECVDGHDPESIRQALENAVGEEGKPSLICARTTIGFGSPNKSGTADVHGAPLGSEETRLAKEALGWPADSKFLVSAQVEEFCRKVIECNVAGYDKWQKNYSSWKSDRSDQYAVYQSQVTKEIPSELKSDLIESLSQTDKEATRGISGKAIQIIAKHLPGFIGGSADLEPSNKTLIKGESDLSGDNFAGRNIRFGVREHAMAGIANGLAYSNCWFPYSATFLVFADYMRPSIRLAALSGLQFLYVFTHDSFWVGEDGPTHQAVEHAASLRIIPNLYLFRPADGLEVALSYSAALERKKGPSALLFTRQSVPPLKRRSGFSEDEVLKGGYVLSGQENEELVIIATGSEVSLAVETAQLLEKEGRKARVVSMPCLELFLEQSREYQNKVIPSQAKKVSIEAGVTVGWERIVGDGGLTLGIDHYGASAPAQILAEKFEFTAPQLKAKIAAWLSE